MMQSVQQQGPLRSLKTDLITKWQVTWDDQSGTSSPTQQPDRKKDRYPHLVI